MNILEKEIEEIVFEADNGLLFRRGLYLLNNKIRQVRLDGYGIADIVCYEKSDNHIAIQIVELKKEEINAGTLLQAVGYSRCIQRIIPEDYIFNIDIVLIGKRVEKTSNFCFMPNIFENLKIYEYSLDLVHGVLFKEVKNYIKADVLSPDFNNIFNTEYNG